MRIWGLRSLRLRTVETWTSLSSSSHPISHEEHFWQQVINDKCIRSIYLMASPSSLSASSSVSEAKSRAWGFALHDAPLEGNELKLGQPVQHLGGGTCRSGASSATKFFWFGEIQR